MIQFYMKPVIKENSSSLPISFPTLCGVEDSGQSSLAILVLAKFLWSDLLPAANLPHLSGLGIDSKLRLACPPPTSVAGSRFLLPFLPPPTPYKIYFLVIPSTTSPPSPSHILTKLNSLFYDPNHFRVISTGLQQFIYPPC